jgi:hypothetical protein
MEQWPQLLGAALLLAGYAGVQFKRLRAESLIYMVLNVVGALLLALDAVRAQQWGFIVLESAWVCFSLPGLWRALRQRTL